MGVCDLHDKPSLTVGVIMLIREMTLLLRDLVRGVAHLTVQRG